MPLLMHRTSRGFDGLRGATLGDAVDDVIESMKKTYCNNQKAGRHIDYSELYSIGMKLLSDSSASSLTYTLGLARVAEMARYISEGKYVCPGTPTAPQAPSTEGGLSSTMAVIAAAAIVCSALLITLIRK